jgi:D-serine deaminase-like pyridoxal phosphate-dependent protein
MIIMLSSDQHKSYRYYRDLFSGSSFPLAFVDLEMLDANCESIAERAGEKQVRIASKSIRSVAVIKHILEKNRSLYSGVMAYHPDEAVHLYNNGIRDILLAYPYCNQDQLTRMAASVQEGALIRLMIDHFDQAKMASSVAVKAGIDFEICLDLDMSTRHLFIYFGVYRSPLKSAADVVALAEKIGALPGLSITSLMGYEAQVAGVGDRIPGKKLQNLLVSRLRRQSHFLVAKRRKEAYDAVVGAGFNVALVNGGGTGSFEFTRNEECVTEITAGSGFFCSGLFDYYSNFRHLPAAAFGLEITRTPAPGMFTAAGGGYIASGATGPEKQPLPYLPREISLVANEGFGEVQTPFYYSGPEPLEIGDPVFFRHSKAGELCERFNHLHLVRNGKIAAVVPTYRGEGLSFL